MPDIPVKSSKRVLEPYDRISEVLFGLIMVLTFTGSLSVAEGGRQAVRTMLLGALGCNLAWGIIDGVLYLMGCLAEKNKNLLLLRAARKANEPQKGQRLVASALPPLVASILQPAELDTIRQRLKDLPEPPERAHVGNDEWLGALGVFLLVFLSTFPVVIPFLLMKDAWLALRLSNTVAIAMLFLTGYAFGRITGRHPWVVGASMVIVGTVLAGLTMALGG
jgi:VIT family